MKNFNFKILMGNISQQMQLTKQAFTFYKEGKINKKIK